VPKKKEHGNTGNEFWKARAKSGRGKKFTVKSLAKAAEEYFQWVEEHPLQAVELSKYKGEADLIEVPKMRAMTIIGFCNFINISKDTWANYKADDEFKETCERIQSIIYQQKFEGAAADLLNASIIARELSLKEHTDHSSEDGTMTPGNFNDFYADNGKPTSDSES
jgi:hypothetical protein